MSGNFPFGFQPPESGDPNRGFDLANLGSMLESLGRMMQSGGSGPINWDLVDQVARQHDAQKHDPLISAGDRAAVNDAVLLADTWLDAVTDFAAPAATAVAWSRGEWVAGTVPAWQRFITPIAEHVQATMSGLLSDQGIGALPGMPPGMPAELSAMLAPLADMTRQLGSAMFATQVGQALGTLSGEVVSSSDIGIPLTDDGRAVLLPGNTNAFADGLGVPRQDVLLYVALRECAHQRLFRHVVWLRPRLEAAIDAYARGIRVDTGQLQDALGSFDPNNPQAIAEALGSGVFEPKQTPEQAAALARLETLLALVEGWVDHVVTSAVGERMSSLPRLTEAMRRRRAAGGPAETTFANLVGLELRPRRLREAAQYWTDVAADGEAVRDRGWEHPDLLPTAEDLDDLPAFHARTGSFDLLPPQLEAPDANDPDDPSTTD